MRYRSRLKLAEALEGRRLLSAQAYTWQNANIGAGGFVDGIFYSPNQQNVIYARTDIGGVYKTTNDGAIWQQLLDFVPSSTGQMMGVLSVALDPENTNDLYLDTGEYTGSDGWVLSSNNGGASFTTTSLPFYVGGNENGRGTGERLAVDPNLGSILFLGSNANGLYQSNNSAGSFTANSAFNTLVGSSSDVTFVTYDARSGTTGHATQTIYVGVDSTAAGTNVYRTTNGGTTWSELTGGPTGLTPQHAVLDSDGNMYFTFSNGIPPNSSLTTGAAWRFNTSNSTWTSISPVVPGANSSDNFGYVGLAVDPEHTGTVVVASFDRYNYTDEIWRTTNATAASPTWVALYDNNLTPNYPYGGNNPTRNFSSAPWITGNGDGIGNWAAAVAINPFNSAQLMYGTGEGIWATNNATSTTTLSAANSWYFPNTGIEFTAVNTVAAPASGIPLYSSMGDIGGFSHTTLSLSPAAGNNNGGSDNDIDFAQSNPSYAAIAGNFTNGGAYSSNSGLTWTHFAAEAGSGGGTLAVSANGSTLVWVPSGGVPYYSTTNGSTWTASTMPSSAPTGSTLTGGKIISDRVNSSYFYYYTENSGDNSLILYVSNDGGKTFTLASQTSTGNCKLVANPFVAGDLWLASYNPLYESTNFGTNFTYKADNNPVSSASQIALGAPAPGQAYAAMYIWGTISGVTGVFRSDDKGATWVQINDTAHQWGGAIQAMAADPSTYGRVYMGFNGRGIITGNPVSSLPTGWSDTDINTPGNFGYATNSSTLSSGTVVNQWTIDGGGAGITGTSDQFNFAADPVTGNYADVAQLKSLTNNGTGTPQAGVMFRASTNPSDAFAALLQTTGNQLLFEYRATTGGTITSVSLGSVVIGSEYLDLVRSGNNFSAYYGTNGATWTQLGTTVSIAAMPATANAGIAVTANYNPQLSSAVFNNVQITAAPTVKSGASVVSQTTTTSSLSVLGADTAGESTLNYSWATTATPAPTFSATGTNAAKATTAMFHAVGTYPLVVTITDTLKQSVTSTISVTVNPVGTVTVSPINMTVAAGSTQTFAASATDQFGNPITGFSYAATGGTINVSTGVFSAGQTGGTFSVTATSGTVVGSTGVSVVPISYSDVSGNNTYAIDINPSVAGQLQIFINTPETGQPAYSIALTQMPSISFAAGTGNDTFTVDFTNGNPVPWGGVSVTGGAGTDALLVIGAAGSNAASVNATQLKFNNQTINYSSINSIGITTGSGNDTLTQTTQPGAAVTFYGGTGSDTLNVNAGNYTFSQNPESATASLIVNDNSSVIFGAGTAGGGIYTMQVAQLNIGASATAGLALSPSSNDRTVLVADTLSINATAQLDLKNNDCVILGGDFNTANTLVASGYNGDAWNGNGIVSSIAAGDTTHLKAVGVISNTYNGIIYPTFDGQMVTTAAILLRYTFIGDTNLDGRVDGSDYTKIDDGYHGSFTGWLNGDFNYDSVVDGSDYTLIDNAFNTQGSALATPTATLALQASVTKPAVSELTGANELISTSNLDSDNLYHRHRKTNAGLTVTHKYMGET